jgi:hypothetical protein
MRELKLETLMRNSLDIDQPNTKGLHSLTNINFLPFGK